MIVTAAQAKTLACPSARAFSEPQKNCRVDGCMWWRWVPLLATEGRFKTAVTRSIAEHNLSHQKAVADVMANKEHYGLPVRPDRGYCGAGGKPTEINWIGQPED